MWQENIPPSFFCLARWRYAEFPWRKLLPLNWPKWQHSVEIETDDVFVNWIKPFPAGNTLWTWFWHLLRQDNLSCNLRTVQNNSINTWCHVECAGVNKQPVIGCKKNVLLGSYWINFKGGLCTDNTVERVHKKYSYMWLKYIKKMFVFHADRPYIALGKAVHFNGISMHPQFLTINCWSVLASWRRYKAIKWVLWSQSKCLPRNFSWNKIIIQLQHNTSSCVDLVPLCLKFEP